MEEQEEDGAETESRLSPIIAPSSSSCGGGGGGGARGAPTSLVPFIICWCRWREVMSGKG